MSGTEVSHSMRLESQETSAVPNSSPAALQGSLAPLVPPRLELRPSPIAVVVRSAREGLEPLAPLSPYRSNAASRIRHLLFQSRRHSLPMNGVGTSLLSPAGASLDHGSGSSPSGAMYYKQAGGTSPPNGASNGLRTRRHSSPTFAIPASEKQAPTVSLYSLDDYAGRWSPSATLPPSPSVLQSPPLLGATAQSPRSPLRRRRSSDPGFSVGSVTMASSQLLAAEQLHNRAREYQEKLHAQAQRERDRVYRKPALNPRSLSIAARLSSSPTHRLYGAHERFKRRADGTADPTPKYKCLGFGSSARSPRHWSASTSLPPPMSLTPSYLARPTPAAVVIGARKGRSLSPALRSARSGSSGGFGPGSSVTHVAHPPAGSTSPTTLPLSSVTPITTIHHSVSPTEGSPRPMSPASCGLPGPVGTLMESVATVTAVTSPPPPPPRPSPSAPRSKPNSSQAVTVTPPSRERMPSGGSVLLADIVSPPVNGLQPVGGSGGQGKSRELAEPDEDGEASPALSASPRRRSSSVTTLSSGAVAGSRLDSLHEIGKQRYRERRLSTPTPVDDHIDACTFRPHINDKSRKLAANMTPVFQRMHQWAANREAKLQQQRSDLQALEDGECSFQPNITSSYRTRGMVYSPGGLDVTDAAGLAALRTEVLHGGVKEFLERQERGRAETHRRRHPRFPDGSQWTGKATVPKEFKLGRRDKTAVLEDGESPSGTSDHPSPSTASVPGRVGFGGIVFVNGLYRDADADDGAGNHVSFQLPFEAYDHAAGASVARENGVTHRRSQSLTTLRKIWR